VIKNPIQEGIKYFRKWAVHFSTLGPIGHIPYFPGTWGSVAATLLAPCLFLPLSFPARILVVLLIFFAGAIASNYSIHHFEKEDPAEVIIDEIGGQFLTYIFMLQATLSLLLIGFLIFRIFDILKPWPISKSEKWLPKGFGIMLDDYVAGIFSALVLTLINYLIHIAG